MSRKYYNPDNYNPVKSNVKRPPIKKEDIYDGMTSIQYKMDERVKNDFNAMIDDGMQPNKYRYGQSQTSIQPNKHRYGQTQTSIQPQTSKFTPKTRQSLQKKKKLSQPKPNHSPQPQKKNSPPPPKPNHQHMPPKPQTKIFYPPPKHMLNHK